MNRLVESERSMIFDGFGRINHIPTIPSDSVAQATIMEFSAAVKSSVQGSDDYKGSRHEETSCCLRIWFRRTRIISD